MEQTVNWKHLVVLVVVSFGLYTATGSFWMSLGILILLLVVDYFLKQYEEKHKREQS